jgi:intracellular septation protein A
VNFIQSLDRKVRYGSAASIVVFVVTYVLVNYVLHRQLSTEEQSLVVGLVPLVVGWVTAWFTSHDTNGRLGRLVAAWKTPVVVRDQFEQAAT